MQLILYSQNSVDPAQPALIDLDSANIQQINEESARQGTIYLSTRPVYESLKTQFDMAGYCDCGEKREKINLKRALRFDEKRDRQRPKMVIFNTTSISAFKRGLNAFITRHYTISDPPCLIIIPEGIHEVLKRDLLKDADTRVSQITKNENDSLYQLLNIPESDPIIKKLEEVYIGNAIKLKHTRALIYRASLTDSPVLILGESGTGKDVIATQIFENSSVYKKCFLRINCSALPEALLESELFGYEKGSYTGAAMDKAGFFAAAENGTIFLDEIGDLSLTNQVKILHAVENKEIRKIGSNISHPVNVRIIAATNRNLDAMMLQGTFRDDLYYRISTFRITSPSLREHPEDIPLLATSYWKRKSRKSILSHEFLEYLKNYQWPGNVRELYTLLNSLVDYFGDIPPRPAHVEAIRKSRQEMLVQSKNIEKNDPSQLLKIKSQNILINVQNILRSIKIGMRPVINQQTDLKNSLTELKNLKKFISQQVIRLNELCLEPAYFKRWDLFKETTHYRYILEKTIENWPSSKENLRTIWISELQKLDDDINQGIMDTMWGKIDM
jgi:DNA-binding NtrC family response regulator